jgi:hypothetical protein
MNDDYGHILCQLGPTFYYITDDGRQTKTFGLSKIFRTTTEVYRYIVQYGLPSSWKYLRLDKLDYLYIRCHKLRYAAREKFGLSLKTPLLILADRFEEEGMMKESKLLRTMVNVKSK